MSIATDTLAFFRSEWGDRFTDSCIVKRVTGQTLNDTTGQYTPTFATNYTGPCLIRPQSAAEVQAGQELLATHGYIVFIPHSETDQLPEDLVDVTSATDGFLTGKQFVVKNVDGDTYATRRALECEDVTSG